jgi:hypothetical protein
MSNLVSYNQFDYRPFQVAPPLNSNHPVQPPIQQPNPVAQQQLQLQPTVRSTQPSPRPGEYGQNTNSAPYAGLSYPPPPPSFDWVVPAITSLLHSQHAATFAKLNEASEQQINLASKVEALQTTTNALQQTVNAVLENLQQVSDTVAKLGADMSSRDATLAERLSALDDAIEAWPTDVRLNGPTSGPPPDGEPQPSHASDESPAQPRPHPLGQGTVEQDQQLHPLKDLIRDASPLEDSATSKRKYCFTCLRCLRLIKQQNLTVVMCWAPISQKLPPANRQFNRLLALQSSWFDQIRKPLKLRAQINHEKVL